MTRYTIGGTTYVQKPLTLGVAQHVTEHLGKIPLSEESIEMISGLLSSPVLCKILACLLSVDGLADDKHLKNLDDGGEEWDKALQHIRSHVSIEIAAEVLKDFFEVSISDSLMLKMEQLMESINNKMEDIQIRFSPPTKKSIASLPEETSASDNLSDPSESTLSNHTSTPASTT